MDGENDGAQAAGSQDGLEPQEPQGYEAEAADKARPIVCFESFQDFLGRGRDGRIKPQYEWVREEDWDLVIFDEYHFGAWNENSKSLFEQEDEDERDTTEDVDTRVEHVNTGNEMDEGDLPIVARFYLYLSGTPFRALNSGGFIEEQIYNWTYSDVQSAKEAWPSEHPGKPKPYEALPRVVMLTYQMPDEIRKVNENAGPEEKVSEFINFLSVLAYDGSAMRPVSATDILDIAIAGTPATLLARRWESAPLVNVENDTLRRIMGNEDAMRAPMSIEGFRNLNEDIETIITLSPRRLLSPQPAI